MTKTKTECQMVVDCKAEATHIGSKGYVYCAKHAESRRRSGYERCRKMRSWELKLIAQGKPLPTYDRVRKPIH